MIDHKIVIVRISDVYSVWNYRKEFIIKERDEYESKVKELNKLRRKIEAEEEPVNETRSNEDNADKDEEKHTTISKQDRLKQLDENESELKFNFQRLCKDELELSEYSLIKNSKSYSAWQHRLFILSVIPEPDFQREFALNENYLQKDGRNCM